MKCQCIRKGYLGVKEEKRHLFDVSSERPADVFIPEWKGGKNAWIAVAVVSPLGTAVWSNATRKRCYAASKTEASKKRHYLEEANKKNAIFIPCVMEEFGGFGAEAVQFLKSLAYGYSAQRGCNVSDVGGSPGSIRR